MNAASLEQNSLKVAVYGNIFMAVLGLTFAWYTDSQAVLLDGVFSLIALIVAVLTLYVSRLIQRPGDDEFPFGYAVFEPLLNFGKGLIIAAVMALALFGSVETLLDGGSDIVVGGAVIYALIASIGCAAIVLFMKRMAKQTESPIIEVEVKNWTITQSPYTCGGTLTSTTTPNIIMTYSDVVTSKNITPIINATDPSSFESTASSWDILFANIDTLNCPINNCLIYSAGSCGTGSYAPGEV